MTISWREPGDGPYPESAWFLAWDRDNHLCLAYHNDGAFIDIDDNEVDLAFWSPDPFLPPGVTLPEVATPEEPEDGEEGEDEETTG